MSGAPHPLFASILRAHGIPAPPICDSCEEECEAGEVVVVAGECLCAVCGYQKAARIRSLALVADFEPVTRSLEEATEVLRILDARIDRRRVARCSLCGGIGRVADHPCKCGGTP